MEIHFELLQLKVKKLQSKFGQLGQFGLDNGHIYPMFLW